MSSTAFLLVATLGLVLLLLGTASFLSPLFRHDPAGEELEGLPMTPLQRRARRGLWIGLLWCAALAWTVMRSDPVSMVHSRGDRLLFTGVLLVGVTLYLALVGGVGGRSARRFLVDERDQTILARASSVQSGAALLTLAACSVGLTEAYWDEGAVPVAYVYLVFWATFVVYLVSYSAGILLGYRRSRFDGEG